MRIIDVNPHKSVVKEKVCYNCGVTLEYVPADVKEKKEYDYSGSGELVRYIECPSCDKHLTV